MHDHVSLVIECNIVVPYNGDLAIAACAICLPKATGVFMLKAKSSGRVFLLFLIPAVSILGLSGCYNFFHVGSLVTFSVEGPDVGETSCDGHETVVTGGFDLGDDGDSDAEEEEAAEDPNALKEEDADFDGPDLTAPEESSSDSIVIQIEDEGAACDEEQDVDCDGRMNEEDDDIDGDDIPNGEDDDFDGDGIPNEEDADCLGTFMLDNIDIQDDLMAIADCETITGNLRIHGTALTDLGFLFRLRFLGGGLFIQGNTHLLSLQGLSALEFVGAELVVTDNDVLGHMDDVDVLATVGGDMEIARNQTLSQLSGFSALEEIGGDVLISENASLCEASVEEWLEDVEIGGESVEIESNMLACAQP
jgi:hypothetical protein